MPSKDSDLSYAELEEGESGDEDWIICCIYAAGFGTIEADYSSSGDDDEGGGDDCFEKSLKMTMEAAIAASASILSLFSWTLRAIASISVGEGSTS